MPMRLYPKLTCSPAHPFTPGHMRRFRLIACLALFALAVSACATVEPVQSLPNGTLVGPLAGTHTAGQTFVADQDGLAGIELLMTDLGHRDTGPLTLHLRVGPTATADLRTLVIPMETIKRDVFNRFDFAPLPDSAGRAYYLLLEAPGTTRTNAVAVWRGDADLYYNGTLYVDGQPDKGQLTFKLIYATEIAQAGWVTSVLRALPMALSFAALLVLPGLALLLWGLPARRDAPALGFRLSPSGMRAEPRPAAAAGEGDAQAERYGWLIALLLAPSVTAALFPLVLLAARWLNLRLDAWAPWLLIVVGAAGVGAAVVCGRAPRLRLSLDVPGLTLLIVALVIVFVRFGVVRTLDVPSWADSHQHTVIVQLMVDHGGLFESWSPYAAFSSFTQQYGFHAAATFLHWLTALPAPRSVVLAGQVFNVLAVLCLYPMTVRLTGNQWAGVFAVLVAGLISINPMQYVNWGRYPQLAGQAVLPVAFWLLMETLSPEHKTFPRGVVLLAGLAAAGMLLDSYRMVHFFSVLALAWWFIGGLRARWAPVDWLRIGVLRAGAVALVTALCILPWEVRLPSGELTTALARTISAASPWAVVLADYNQWNAVNLYGPTWLAGMAVAGWVWALTRRRWEVVTMGVWVAGLATIPLLRLVRFPFATFFQTFGLIIMLYIPIAVLVGWLACELMRLIERDTPRAFPALLVCALLAGMVLGAAGSAQIIDPDTIMVTPADMRAMSWARAHTPPGAVFAVNSRIYENELTMLGTDAGWWLPLLAGRTTLVPPMYAAFGERESVPGSQQRLMEMGKALAAHPAPDPAGVAALCRAGVTHVYIGQRKGMIGRSARNVDFDPQALAASPDFQTLYHSENVWVFALTPGACPP
jgi:hypothetical protein